MKRIFAVLWIIACAFMAKAQEHDAPLRPVNAAYTVSAGSGHLVDTYLSPLKYSGWALSLDYERTQDMRFDPQRWTMRLAGRLEGMKTRNIARNANLWDAGLHLSWGMTRRWSPLPDVELAAGGSTSLYAGVLYNQRNSNNPVAAKAAWTLNLTGSASWQLKLRSLPVTLVYRPTFPVVGAFFSPDYGELYYEIYLGNHKGLAHCAWWGNYLAMENLITADLHLGATALRLGFRANTLSTRINNINTRISSLCFVLGVSGSWISVDNRKRMK